MKKTLRLLTLAIVLVAMLFTLYMPALADAPAKLKVSVMGPDSVTYPSSTWAEYPTYQELMKLFDEAGLELEFVIVANEQYATTVQTQMAAGINLPDVVNIGALDNTAAINLGAQGTILDVTPLIAQYSNGSIEKFLDDYKFARKETIAPNGSSYWFVGVSRFEIESQPGKLAYSTLSQQYRMDWREALGIAEPTTTDEFYDMLLQFREKDANGDSMQNEIMLVNLGSFANGIASWFGLGMDLTYTDHNTKKVVSPWLQPGIEPYIAYMQKLVEAGIIDLQMVGASTEMNNQKLYSNCVASQYGYTLTSPEKTMTDYPDAKYAPAGPLQAVEGITPAVMGEISEITLQKFAITKDCRSQEAAIRFFDVVYSEPYCQLLAWGREGFEFEYRDGAKHLTKEMGTFDRDVANTTKLMLGRYFAWTVFPCVQNLNLESQMDGREDQPYKTEWQLKYNDYVPMYYIGSNLYALPDEATAQRKAELLNNLTTYATESLTKLCSGEMNISELPAVVEELKRLGLEELVQINQALFDKYNAS